MTFVYGPGGSKYTSAEEAEAHMVEIAVPVWRLQSDGTKTTGTAYLQVNASLAAIYKAIFEEIYNGAEKFPINDVGCYSWRTGEHSQGTASISTRTRTWRRPSTPTARSPRPAVRTGRRTPTRSPFPRAATFTTPSPSTASPGAATPGAQQARLHALQLLRQVKKISKRLLYAVFSFCKKAPGQKAGRCSLSIKSVSRQNSSRAAARIQKRLLCKRMKTRGACTSVFIR